jgi:hypothetical protein
MFLNPSAFGKGQYHALAIFIQDRVLSQSLTVDSVDCRAILDAVSAGTRPPVVQPISYYSTETQVKSRCVWEISSFITSVQFM